MAYICLIDSRGESRIAGVSWVDGWKVPFCDLLADPQFRDFIGQQQRFYDDEFCLWLDALISRTQEMSPDKL